MTNNSSGVKLGGRMIGLRETGDQRVTRRVRRPDVAVGVDRVAAAGQRLGLATIGKAYGGRGGAVMNSRRG